MTNCYQQNPPHSGQNGDGNPPMPAFYSHQYPHHSSNYWPNYGQAPAGHYNDPPETVYGHNQNDNTNNPYTFLFQGGAPSAHYPYPDYAYYQQHGKRDHSAYEYHVEETEEIHKRAKKTKRSDDMPRRPLSAYNFFFSEEREIILALLPDPEASVDIEASKRGNIVNKEELKEIRDQKLRSIERILSANEIPEDQKAALNEKIKASTKKILDTHLEGDRAKKSHKKSHGKIAFQTLAKLIGQRWRKISTERKATYLELAKKDLERYNRQMANDGHMSH